MHDRIMYADEIITRSSQIQFIDENKATQTRIVSSKHVGDKKYKSNPFDVENVTVIQSNR